MNILEKILKPVNFKEIGKRGYRIILTEFEDSLLKMVDDVDDVCDYVVIIDENDKRDSFCNLIVYSGAGPEISEYEISSSDRVLTAYIRWDGIVHINWGELEDEDNVDEFKHSVGIGASLGYMHNDAERDPTRQSILLQLLNVIASKEIGESFNKNAYKDFNVSLAELNINILKEIIEEKKKH